jgi:ribosomal protein S18 acetylase RimI-like enzyme
MKQDYEIREMKEDDFLPLFDKHKKSVFEDVHSYSLNDLLTDAEQKKTKILGEGISAPYKLYLGAFDKDNQFVGWSWGQQENSSTFYMVNSAVLPDHRRKGLYGALIKKCVEVASRKGYQLIYSRHCATNNAVIIPKLKAGFTISKMEISDRYGVLIQLDFYMNETRRRIIDYRAGQLKPDGEIKRLFGM